jgi:large subunit ribosomal protein L25
MTTLKKESELELPAILKKDSESGKKFAKAIRNEGNVPAVIYGQKKPPVAISLDPVYLVKQLNASDYKRNQIFVITIDGAQSERVIAKDINVNPVNNQFIHVDFLRVNDNDPIQVNIPVRTNGISAGQRLGGVLVRPKSAVLIECLPQDIPVEIVVDVTDLKIGENIRTHQLSVSGSQKVISNPNDILIKIESTKLSKAATAES